MKIDQVMACILFSLSSLPLFGQATEDISRSLKNPPPGVFVDSSKEVPAVQVQAIGQKLGGNIQRLSNSVVRVNGRPIQVNMTAILEWLSPGKNLKYSGEVGSRWGARKVFEQKFGHCWDFSDCFVTMARAVGIPSRQVAGWLYGNGGHVWAEYYRDGKGWQQVDPTGGGKLPCGIYHIPYFATDDGEMPILYVSMPKIQVIDSK